MSLEDRLREAIEKERAAARASANLQAVELKANRLLPKQRK